jgi:hypothetical protein
MASVLSALSERLAHVRVTCGDFARILGGWAKRMGTVGVFLDPPYLTDDTVAVYGVEAGDVAIRAWTWAIEHGDDPGFRVAICGYAGQYPGFPATWTEVAWKATGGYAIKPAGRGFANKTRERIWFSPGCMTEADGGQRTLFDA